MAEKSKMGTIGKYFRQARRQLDDLFVNNIPIDALKEHPWYTKYIIGFITLFGYYAALATLTWIGYVNSAGSTFMSLGYGSDPCIPVSRPLTGIYLATVDGIWEGQPGFHYNSSMYRFKFNNFMNFSHPKYDAFDSKGPLNANYNCDYICLMKFFENEVIALKQKSKQPLSLNLLAWMAYIGSVKTGDNAVQSIELVGDPAVVFNRPLLWTSLVSSASASHICSVYSNVRFDTATAMFKIRYNFHEYMADPFCQSVLLPETHGHYVIVPGITGRRLDTVGQSTTFPKEDFVAFQSFRAEDTPTHRSNHQNSEESSRSVFHLATTPSPVIKTPTLIPSAVPSPPPSKMPTPWPEPSPQPSPEPSPEPSPPPSPESSPEPLAPSFSQLQLSVINDYEIDIDMRTIALAMGVNLNVVDLNTMEKAGPPVFFNTSQTVTELLAFFHFPWHPAKYYIQDYYDPSQPGMTPMSCVFNMTKTKVGSQVVPGGDQFILCLYKVGSGYMMPILHQIGGPKTWGQSSWLWPQYCGCDSAEIGHSMECNLFGFLVGLVTFQLDSLTSFENVEGFIFVYSYYIFGNSSYVDYNRKFYNATLYSATRDIPAELYGLDNGQTHAEYLETLCGPFCTMLVVGATDDPSTSNLQSHFVSPYFHEVPKASCTDSFTTPYFYKLIENPPAALFQDYLNCSYSSYENFMNSLGIAQGNIATFLEWFTIVVMPLLTLLLVCLGERTCFEGKEQQEEHKKEGEYIEGSGGDKGAAVDGLSASPRLVGLTPVDEVAQLLAQRGICTVAEVVAAIGLTPTAAADLENKGGLDLSKPASRFLLFIPEVLSAPVIDQRKLVYQIYGLDAGGAADCIDFFTPLFTGTTGTDNGAMDPQSPVDNLAPRWISKSNKIHPDCCDSRGAAAMRADNSIVPLLLM